MRDVAELAAVAAAGAQLRHAGLNARAVAAWAGTARVAALATRLEPPPAARTPAGAVLALFLAGAEVERDRLRTLPDPAIEALIAHALLERVVDRLRARVAIVPVGSALLVCDRHDAAVERDLVCWPDDSSHHLASAIPAGRRADWLDLGCGSAFAPLARPDLAGRIAGVDLNPRAVRYAELGAALSGVSHLAVSLGDIADPRDTADLVTCNAPMPPARAHRAGGDPWPSAMPEIWRRADPDFFSRLWPALGRAVRPAGLIVVHGASEAVLPALADAPGERVVVTYTPAGVPGFAVAWWRPDAPATLLSVRRTLTPDRPHLDPRDRTDALGDAPRARPA